ncbi:MAG: AlpA family phage regulatory protein [bacterium]|nr:AlpA family phage regulatory protein [Acidimicrobiia bacterium]MCY4650390.1 AlpA family phage regulatory protein [bacterium]
MGEILENTRLCKSQLYRLMAAGEFPKPVRLGPRTVRWTNKSVRCWVENLPQEE